MASAETILDRAEGRTKIDRSAIGISGLGETQLLAVLNGAKDEWLEAHRKAGGEYPEYMEKDTGGTLVSPTKLDGAVATTDTTIDVDDSSNLDSSGAIAIYDEDMPDIVEYTGTSSNQLTGVTLIGFAHEDDDDVVKLYALPSDFHDFREQSGGAVRVDGSRYTYTSGIPRHHEYSIYDNGSSKFIWFPRDLSGDFHVFYNKQGTTIDDTSDTVSIPDSEPKNQWFLVHRVAQHIFDVLGFGDRAERERNLADLILSSEMRKRNIGKSVKTLRDARQLNAFAGSSRVSQYLPRAGFRGFFK